MSVTSDIEGCHFCIICLLEACFCLYTFTSGLVLEECLDHLQNEKSSGDRYLIRCGFNLTHMLIRQTWLSQGTTPLSQGP